MLLNRKAFTLVEMLVALAVSSIVIIAAYASYDMVKTQYEKNIGIADMHTSGRAIMRIIERDIRMAGYEHRDSSGNKIFSTGITSQLVLSESNNVCCDGVSVIYDHSTDAEDGVERKRIAYSVREFPGKEKVDYELLDSDTTRYRLYKKIDVLGRDGTILATEESGTEQVLADFVEDLQFSNITNIYNLYTGSNTGIIRAYNPVTGEWGIQEINRNTRGTVIDVTALAFGPDGLLYTGASIGGIIRVYNPSTGEWGIQETNRNTRGTVIGVRALAFKNNRTGKESLVNIKLTLRSKNKRYPENKTYTKAVDEEHHIGDYNFEFNDKYKRDVFFSTVAVRNMLL